MVVPVFNEAESVESLYRELLPVLKSLRRTHEIIFVNDGSTDGTLKTLAALKGITIINLNRNYGQATALDAGFKAAQGDIIVSLDADGQNDPRDIPTLLKKLHDEKLDVVAGWRGSVSTRKNSLAHALSAGVCAAFLSRTSCTTRAARCAPTRARRQKASTSAARCTATFWRFCGGRVLPSGRSRSTIARAQTASANTAPAKRCAGSSTCSIFGLSTNTRSGRSIFSAT